MRQDAGSGGVRWSLWIVAAAAAVAAGCQSVPQGESGGRIDPYRTTASDRASNRANIPSLLEFSDQTAERLAYDLVNLKEIREAQTKMVLELGDLRNKTGTPTSDFELIQTRVRGALLKSPLIRQQFTIVASRARMNREEERVMADGSAGSTARYDPGITYLLMGDFFEANRGDRRQYYFEFTLTNLGSREIVFQNDYDLGQTN